MEIKFIPIDYDYFDWKSKSYAKIIGRSDKGKRICIIDACEVYFWAILNSNVSNKKIEQMQRKIKKIKIQKGTRISRVLKTELCNKNYLGKSYKAIKIFVTNFKDAHSIASKIDFKEVYKRREYDLNFITKYILEKKLNPLTWYQITGKLLNNSEEFGGIDSNLNVDFCLKIKEIKKTDQIPFKPKILAYDIETAGINLGKTPILMISLVGENYKKVLTWKKKSKKSYVETFKDEEEMLEGFVKSIKKYDPDILVGYYSDGFDLPYLKIRAEKNKMRLNLGLDDSQPKFSRGRLLTGKIKGITHIDLLRFIRTVYAQYLKSETLSLNEVAFELLGEKKLDFSPSKQTKLENPKWEDFFKYNLQDSILTYKLTEKLWPDLLELTKIVQEPLFNISRAGLSNLVENYIIHNLNKYNEIAEKHPIHEEISKRRKQKSVEGAFVFRPIPGLYENLAIFDFTSMHTSIIVSFNISKATLLEKKEKNSYESPELEFENKKTKFYFSKKPGFFPLILKELFEKRKEFKQEYKKNPNPLTKARSNAFKLLSASIHGYQGFFGARYYSLEASASVLAFVRKFNKQIIEETNKAGYGAIYGDSISGNTKIIIKKNNKIYEDNIENLFNKIDSKNPLGKEYDFKKNIEVLTLDNKGKSIFKPLIYVMRHKCKKDMYKVNLTNNWSINVTENHSLMGYQSTHHNQSKKVKQNPLNRIIEIKPEEIKKKVNSIITLKKIPEENPKTKDYPKKVYEFMGFFIGDGSFIRNKSHQKHNKDYYLRLSLGSDKEEIFNKLIAPLKKLGYIKSHWWSKTKQGDLTINGLKLVNLISKNCRNKNNKKAIPKWLFNEKEENIKAFLRGLFSVNGCAMTRNNAPIIKYTSISKDYIKEVRKLLYRVGISHSVFKENSINKYTTKNKIYSTGSSSKNIVLKDKEEFAEKIGFLLERKNKRAKIKTKNTQKKLIKDFEFNLQSAKSIEKIKTPKYVYDLEVKDTHTFFANYVLAHNTDSIAFTLNKHTKKQTLNLLEKINKQLPGIMELDLEDFYKRGLWVTKRTGEFGAKKKYALINEENKIKIRGFETVRRDWCDLARKTQNKILNLILTTGNEQKALDYIKKIIKKIKNREIPLDQLLIRTQLKKPLSEYKSISPHVMIAKKMQDQGIPIDVERLITYYISENENKNKRGLIREKAKLPNEPGKYNIEYYLNNQVLPSVENIFEVFKINIKEFIEGKNQKKLFEF